MNKTTRRSFLAATSVSATALAFSEVAAAPGPDAELLILGRELEAAWKRQTEVFALIEKASDEEADEAYEACNSIALRIERVLARTLAGLKVKALALSWTHSGEAFDEAAFG